MTAPEPAKAANRRRSDRSRSGPGGLVDAWADLAKACSIYTVGHQRVRDCLGRFRSLLETSLGSQGSLAVTFVADVARVGREEIDVTHCPNPQWLRERLDRSLLAGAEFTAGASAQALLDFTERLVAISHQTPQATKFEELWPQTYDGVRPLPRHYDEVFLGSGGRGEGDGAMTRGGKLAELLESSEMVRQRMARLEALLASLDSDSPGNERVGVDLIAEIVRQMPVEAHVDPAKTVELTAAILEAMTNELASRCSNGAVANRLALEQVMHSISRKYFFDASESSLATPSDTERQALAASEAARQDLDDRVTDDVPALLAELAGLADSTFDLRREAELPQEQLGVYLHFLIHSKPGEQTVRLHPILRRLLLDANQDTLDCLLAYLEYAEQLALDVDDWTYLDNVISFLTAANLTPLARRCGYFVVPRLRRIFPRLFLMYLTTIDWRQEDEVTTLEQLCALLGPEAILGQRQHLLAGGGLHANGLDLRILAHPRPTFLPLVHLILCESGEARSEAVAAFLSRALPKTRETCLLDLWPNPAQIPLEYLTLLTQRSPAAHYPPALAGVLVRMLRRLIEEHAANPLAAELRSEAIRLLGELGAREQRPFLVELLRARRLLGLPREPRVVRQAAREAIARLGPGDTPCAK